MEPGEKTETAAGPAPKIVVAGAGFSGLEAAFYVRRRLGRRAEITVVSETDTFLFKPNTIYVPFGKPPEAFQFPLRPAFEKRQIPFVQSRVHAVDPIRKKLYAEGAELDYDYLFLATGAAMRPAEIPGLAEHANTIWTPSEMMRLRGSLESLLERAKAGTKSRVRFVVPPNNKCSGPLYEMIMMLDTWLRRNGVRENVDVGLSTYEKGYIQAFGVRLNEFVSNEFERRGISGRKQTALEHVEPNRAVFKDGNIDEFDFLISFPPYIASTRFEGLAMDDRGFIAADPKTRQVKDQKDIYVVGDAGDFPVKQAFLGLLQADAAAEHCSERILGEEPMAAFDPVSMCVMEQFDKATFAQVPLRPTPGAEVPVAVREDVPELYRVGSGTIWRVAKKALGMAIPHRFTNGQPFHAGPTWAVMEAGVKAMAAVFAE